MLKRKTRKAFTLVELIVVIVILAVLAAIAFMVLTKMIWKSRDSRRVADLSTISKALQTYLINENSSKTLSTTDSSFVSWYAKFASYSWNFSRIWLFTWSYFTTLKNAWLDSLPKLPKDPKWKSYVISVYNSKTDFNIAATLENIDSDTAWNKAAVDWNFFNKKVLWTWTTYVTFPTSLLKWTADTSAYALSTTWTSTLPVNNTWTALFITDWSTTNYPYTP